MPDSDTLLVATPDGAIRTYDPESGVQTKELVASVRGSELFAASASGLRFALAKDGLVQVWGTRSQGLLAELGNRYPRSRVLAIALSHDGSYLAVSRMGGSYLKINQPSKIEVWDVEERSLMQSVFWDGAPARQVAFGPTHFLIIGACTDNLLRVWDVKTAKKMPSDWLLGDVPSSVIINHWGTQLAASFGNSPSIKVWDFRFRTDWYLPKSTGPVRLLSEFDLSGTGLGQEFNQLLGGGVFDRTGQIVANVRIARQDPSGDPKVVLTDAAAPLVSWRSGILERRVAVSPDKARIAVAVSRGSRFNEHQNTDVVKLCDRRTGAVERSIKVGQPIEAVAFSDDGRYVNLLVNAKRADYLSYKNIILFIRYNSFGGSHEVVSEIGEGTIARFSRDGSLFTVGGSHPSEGQDAGSVWDTKTIRRLRGLNSARMGILTNLEFSSDRRFIAGSISGVTGSTKDVVTVWDARTGLELLKLDVPDRGSVDWLGFSPRGTHLIAGYYTQDGLGPYYTVIWGP
jgi:WD40 repeat protein